MTRHPARGPRRHALLASLSGASTALLAAADAQATIHVTPVNKDFAFANPNVTQTFNLVGGAAFQLFATTGITNGVKSHALGFGLGPHITSYFRIKGTKSNLLSRVGAGVKWGGAPGGALVGGTISAVTSKGGTVGGGLFSNKYFLFEFKDNSVAGDPMRYGWIEGSLTDDTYQGLSYHFTEYAYDDTGAQIAAGDTGAVPEPSSSVLGGIGAAMVMGAAGVRRWKRRAARPAGAGDAR